MFKIFDPYTLLPTRICKKLKEEKCPFGDNDKIVRCDSRERAHSMPSCSLMPTCIRNKKYAQRFQTADRRGERFSLYLKTAISQTFG